MSEIVEGRTVTLASGGPAMTVRRVDTVCGEAHCEWFDARGAVQTRRFALATLRARETEGERWRSAPRE